MKRRASLLVLLAAALTAHAAEAPSADAGQARYDDPLAAIEDYQAGLEALLAAIPDATAASTGPAQSLERLVSPRLAWGRWRADGQLTAVSDGSRSAGAWIMVLEPDHPQLATPGPTMMTRSLDIGVLVVQVRPDRITRRWAGLFLMHEMSHAHDHLYAFERPACGAEYAAFNAEADALHHLTAGRFRAVLDRLVAERGWQTPAHYLEFLRDRDNLAQTIDAIESTLGEAPAISAAERQMRDGFYLVAIGERVGVRAGLDEGARCEASAALIAHASLY